MSRFFFRVDERREVVCGYDPPFGTWYAQLYDRVWSEHRDSDDSPMKTVGYHPTEQALSHADTEHGPYPMPTFTALATFLLGEWGVAIPPEKQSEIRETGP